MSKADVLAVKIAQEIENALAARLGKIPNPTIRKAIEDNIRDNVYQKLDKSLTSEVGSIIDQSIDDVVKALQGASVKKKPALRTIANDFGGKSSGGKESTYTPPSRSGGKESPRFGGK